MSFSLPKKKRKEEEELISRIESYRQEFISALQNKFVQERDGRHSHGEVFFEGHWVPKALVPKIRQVLAKRGRVVFFEIHLLFLGVASFNILLWIICKIFLLP